MTATADTAPRETLEQSITRLADCIGHLSPKRWGRYNEIDRVRFEMPRMPGMNLHTLTALLSLPEANEIVTATCNHCPQELQCRRIVAPFVACDACIERKKIEDQTERQRDYWATVCPKGFQATDLEFVGNDVTPAFPKAIYAELVAHQKANPNQNYFFYGPTGTAKTRVSMLLLKRALTLQNRRVGVLWPEKLSTLKPTFDTNAFDHYANYDVLLMDDSLLSACREPRLLDTVKQLIDVRMREDRPFIVTSQIGQEEEIKEGKEFGDAKTADIERIKALMRRLRETCKVVSFAKPPAGNDTSHF